MPKPKARKAKLEDYVNDGGEGATTDAFGLHLRLDPAVSELEDAASAVQLLLMANAGWQTLARRMLAGDVAAGRDLARLYDGERPHERPVTATILLLASQYGSMDPATQFNEHREGMVLAALLDSTLLALEEISFQRAMLETAGSGEQRSGHALRMAKRGLVAALTRLRLAVCGYGWADSADRLILMLTNHATTSRDQGTEQVELRQSTVGRHESSSEPTSDLPVPGRIVAANAKSVISQLGSSDKKRFAAYESLAAPVVESMLPNNADAALEVLGVEMPNFLPALDRVLEELALRRWVGEPAMRFAPLLLVGPPGVGKSRFARSLAVALEMEFGYMSLEGLSDNRSLAGTATGWSSCEPCWPVREISRLKVANPLLMLDEIDKCSASHNGDNLATLLTWLEPSTSATSVDPVLGGGVDLRGISWILAANRIDHLSGHLLSRVRVLQIEAPHIEAYGAVLQAILRDLAVEHGLPDYRLLPQLSAIQGEFLRQEWRRSRSPRVLRKVLERLLARNAMDDSSSRAAH